MIYLDNSATTQTSEKAAAVALQYMRKDFFNASSLYSPAVAVERNVQAARACIARTLGANEDEIIFTSGGTESNNMAVLGTSSTLRPGVWRFITTTMEHPAVYEVFGALERSGQEVLRLNVDAQGQVDLQALQEAVNERTALVSIMHVNNEFGAVANLETLRNVIKRRNPHTLFHSDGVQAYGKLFYTTAFSDLYSISGHKFHAPKGVGALLIRNGVKNGGGLIGGGQERGMRSGTLNTSGIVAMGVAAEEITHSQSEHMMQCKLRLAQNLLQISDVVVNGPAVQQGAPNILNLSFLGVRGEVLLHALEERRVYVSTGSACSSHKRGTNRVLAAIGVTGERALSAVRFSLSKYNTLAEMDVVAEVVSGLVNMLRRYQRR